MILRPSAVGDRFCFQQHRVDDAVSNTLALPRVGRVDEPVARLDNRGITVFARLALEHECSVPILSIRRGGDI